MRYFIVQPLTFGCLLTALFTRAVGADEIATPPRPIAYSTSGSIGTEGVFGTNAISFTGRSDAAIYDSSKGSYPLILPPGAPTFPPDTWEVPIGDFQIAPGFAGTTTYIHTPFDITFSIAGASPILLHGTLNGTISGQSYSSVGAQFDPFGILRSPGGDQQFPLDSPFTIAGGGRVNTISGIEQTVGLLPAAYQTNGDPGGYSYHVEVSPQAVPEPTTLALAIVLASTLIPWRLARRRRAGVVR